jgi:hypothetical protein
LRAVATLLIVVLLFVWFIVSILKGSDEIQARSEWSVLQNLEVRYRKYPTDRAVLLDKQPPYCAAGVVALDGHARVWILLDAKTKPLLKKLPDLNYRLSGDDMSEILRACPVSNDVRIELQSHVADKM